MNDNNLNLEVNKALTKLMGAMILADGRTEKLEVKEAVYFLNNIFNQSKLNITLSKMQEVLKSKINIESELQIIKSANLSEKKRKHIVNAFIHTALSDGEYHKNEADLATKISKELNISMDNEVIGYIKEIRPQLLKIRKMREENEAKLSNIFDKVKNRVEGHTNKENANSFSETLQKLIDFQSKHASAMNLALDKAVENNKITQEQSIDYLLFMTKMPPQFSIMAGTLAAHSPDEFIKTVQNYFKKDKPNYLGIVIGIGVIIFLLYQCTK